ncbi:hypothetical protein B0T22DRAFT_10979 [Podospora appendiculata]|uniref:Uncharacterized protein n=1 Tax=Podospora appendiculata TaxID=314037 RepID=A0AAE1CFI8_9PEZI|nr:hypothetical protein B0T22DRAFT_10979 [Podospora appendiculata]
MGVSPPWPCCPARNLVRVRACGSQQPFGDLCNSILQGSKWLILSAPPPLLPAAAWKVCLTSAVSCGTKSHRATYRCTGTNVGDIALVAADKACQDHVPRFLLKVLTSQRSHPPTPSSLLGWVVERVLEGKTAKPIQIKTKTQVHCRSWDGDGEPIAVAGLHVSCAVYRALSHPPPPEAHLMDPYSLPNPRIQSPNRIDK